MIPRKHWRKHGFCLVLPSKFMGSCESLPGDADESSSFRQYQFCCCTSLDDESHEHVAIEILIRAKKLIFRTGSFLWDTLQESNMAGKSTN
jgi:hypothetical protein